MLFDCGDQRSSLASLIEVGWANGPCNLKSGYHNSPHCTFNSELWLVAKRLCWLFLDFHISCMDQTPSSVAHCGALSVCLDSGHQGPLPALSRQPLLQIIAGLGEETPPAPVATVDRVMKEEPSSSLFSGSARQPINRLWLSPMYNGPPLTLPYHPLTD